MGEWTRRRVWTQILWMKTSVQTTMVSELSLLSVASAKNYAIVTLAARYQIAGGTGLIACLQVIIFLHNWLDKSSCQRSQHWDYLAILISLHLPIVGQVHLLLCRVHAIRACDGLWLARYAVPSG